MKLSKLLKMILTPFLFMSHVDVEYDEQGNVIGTGNDARVKLLNQIGDNADRIRGEEFYEEDDAGNRSEFTFSDNETTTEEEEKSEQEVEEEHESTQVDETGSQPQLTTPPAKYKIKVNGVEKEVSIEEVLSIAQKVESADQYLREAANLNQEAKKLANPQAKQQPQPKVEELDDVSLARTLQMGSEEEAAAAIRSLRKPSLSQDDLAKTVDERLNFQMAVQWFNSEFNDITSDPVLNQLAINQDNVMRANGDNRPYKVRYAEIGKSIRGWVESKTGKSQTAPEDTTETVKQDTLTSKKAKKANAPQVPKAAHGKVETPVEEEEEESVQDTIAKMAQSRGGPQWLRG
jgi:hypothetical protein